MLKGSDALDPWSTHSDGGGVRGLSALVILREMMERIQYQQQLDDTPLPCDYFDLIGGTGAGGYVITAVISCSVSPHRWFFQSHSADARKASEVHSRRDQSLCNLLRTCLF